jgi:uroporphyrinogen III methyltransferase/synthase
VTAAALAGVRVVVTRARHQAGVLGRLLTERGAGVLYVPVIEIAPPKTWDAIDAAVRRAAAGDFEWVVFTSANAAAAVVGRNGAPEALRATRVAAVGPATAAVLGGLGRPPDLVPQEFTAVAAATALGPGPGRVLLPRAAGAPPDIVVALRAAGWTVEDVGAYRNVVAGPAESAHVVEAGDFEAVTFTSGSAARNFAAVVGPPEPLGLGPGGAKVVACIGPQTAAAARAAGYGVDVVALEHTASGLVDALATHLGRTRMAP